MSDPRIGWSDTTPRHDSPLVHDVAGGSAFPMALGLVALALLLIMLV